MSCISRMSPATGIGNEKVTCVTANLIFRNQKIQFQKNLRGGIPEMGPGSVFEVAFAFQIPRDWEKTP
jgi:hypothetical protein